MIKVILVALLVGLWGCFQLALGRAQSLRNETLEQKRFRIRQGNEQ